MVKHPPDKWESVGSIPTGSRFLFVVLLFGITSIGWAGTWCKVDDNGGKVCGMSRSACKRAVKSGQAADCIYQEEEKKIDWDVRPKEGYGDTTQAQSCIAGGLNPDCTPKQ